MAAAEADLKATLVSEFGRDILTKTLRTECIPFGKELNATGLAEIVNSAPLLGIHHLLQHSDAGTLRALCEKLKIETTARSKKDRMALLLQFETEHGGLDRIRRRLAAGGKERYGAVIELIARNEAGIDVSSLKADLAECLFDEELGTYLRTYWLFDAFVTQQVDLSEQLPKLIERAQDSYHSGQQLCTTLCRYAELSVEHALQVLRIGRAQGIAEEDYEEPYASDLDFTATATDAMMDELSGPRTVVRAPEWFKQIKLLASPQKPGVTTVAPKTLRWGSYGVTIGGGRLNWFEDAGGSYSQSYTEFLANGQNLLWIDRAMPEEIRQQVYAALGTKAPHEPSPEERRQEFMDFCDAWQKRTFLAKAACPVCRQIPNHASRGENNADGAWDSFPAEHAALTRLMANLHRHEIHGCEKCGQLYDYSTYHDNIMGQQEDSESLDKIEIDTLRAQWLADIAAGGRITYF